ncbi:hypothetical protein PMIN05_000255 [Paraphaeosphaeria minitans]
MHKIMNYERYDPPTIAELDHKINILKDVENDVGGKVRETVAEGVTLGQVFDDYIEPGKILRLAGTMPRIDTPPNKDAMEKRRSADRYRDYVVFDAFSTGAQAEVGGRKATRARGNHNEITHMLGLREVKLQLGTPMTHFAQMLDKAYQFIELGCPVEFDICIRHCTDKQAAVLFKGSNPINSLDYVYKHFPHLRSDFIHKSMPIGTRWIVYPFTNSRHVQFVLGRATKRDEFGMSNFTKRVLKVQKAVIQGVEEGWAQQLPRKIRSAIARTVSSKGCAQATAPMRTRRGDLDRMWKKDENRAANEAKHQRNLAAKLGEVEKESEGEANGAAEQTYDEGYTRHLEEDADASPSLFSGEHLRKRPLGPSYSRSLLGDIQGATNQALAGEETQATLGEKGNHSFAPGSYAHNATDEIPEEKRQLWEAWTAGGKDNVSRYYVASKKDASKSRDKTWERFSKSQGKGNKKSPRQ